MPSTSLLIVEDEAIIAMELEDRLGRMGYMIAGAVASGEDALEAAAVSRPDLVLMDIFLQGPADGIATAQELRARFDLPIVYLTAFADDETLRRAQVTEPFGYLLKPFRERELHATIEMALYRHRVERELLRSRAQYERVVTHITEALIIEDVDGRITYANAVFSRLLGLGPDEQSPLTIADRIRQPWRDEWLERRAQSLAAPDRVSELECPLSRQDGTQVWLAATMVSIIEQGCPVGLQIVMRDITVRRQAEAERAGFLTQLTGINNDLQRSGKLLSTLINSLEDGLAILDAQGTILKANSALAGLLQAPLGQIVGQRWPAVCPVQPPRARVLEGSPAVARERLTRPDGTGIVIDLLAFPVFAPDGALEQTVLHIVDITERLQQQQLAIQNERLAAMGRLAAAIAHEIGTPLQAIQNWLYLAASDPAERDQHLAMLGDELERVSGLVRRFLDLNRPGTTAPEPIRINDLVERALALTASTLKRRQVTPVADLAPALPPIVGRGDNLTQVLLNLLFNAVDAMPRGGTLTITTREHAPGGDRPAEVPVGHMLTIEVRDTGEGIPASLLPRIFEEFVTTKAQGSGIGLTISRQIVEQHGGRLVARNGLQGGAILTVILPVGASAQGEAAGAPLNRASSWPRRRDRD